MMSLTFRIASEEGRHSGNDKIKEHRARYCEECCAEIESRVHFCSFCCMLQSCLSQFFWRCVERLLHTLAGLRRLHLFQSREVQRCHVVLWHLFVVVLLAEFVHSSKLKLAGRLGLEPKYAAPEAAVLPIVRSPICTALQLSLIAQNHAIEIWWPRSGTIRDFRFRKPAPSPFGRRDRVLRSVATDSQSQDKGQKSFPAPAYMRGLSFGRPKPPNEFRWGRGSTHPSPISSSLSRGCDHDDPTRPDTLAN